MLWEQDSRRTPSSSFNPLPPAEARGDTQFQSKVPANTIIRSFNPLPPPKRGETTILPVVRRCWVTEVSIHSPRRSEGRPAVPAPYKPGTLRKEFQSTPPAEARGDTACRAAGTACLPCFNPLPPPKRGETLDGTGKPRRPAIETCFNPLPPPKRGETCGTESAESRAIDDCFNPLPPPKRGETWGSDRRSALRLAHVHGVSIHSPRRSEGRP